MKQKKKKKHEVTVQKIIESVRRQSEIDAYGKTVSLRGQQEHGSKKTYTRKQKHKGDIV